MTRAIMWLDEDGGVIWLRRHLRWRFWQSFSWQQWGQWLEYPALLPPYTEVAILIASPGERLAFDSVSRIKRWERNSAIKRKCAAHFPDSPYTTGIIQGQINALQARWCGMALPREWIDSVLTYLYSVRAVCREIIPVASLFMRLTQKQRLGTGLWIVMYRQMHCYFIDSLGLRMCRTVALPADTVLFVEEVKKIHRYLLGQKWLAAGEALVVRCRALTEGFSGQDLPPLDGIQWERVQQEQRADPVQIPLLWQRYRGKMNCAPPLVRSAYLWHCWNRRAWCAFAAVVCTLVGVSGYTVTDYWRFQQQQLRLQTQIIQVTQHKKPLTKIAEVLLAIDAYRQTYQHPNYEEILLRLSHLLVDFPLWSLDNLEWQRQTPHQLDIVGKWQRQEDIEALNVRIERALMRYLQAKQVRINVLNRETGQTQITVYFDRPTEEG